MRPQGSLRVLRYPVVDVGGIVNLRGGSRENAALVIIAGRQSLVDAAVNIMIADRKTALFGPLFHRYVSDI
jgi:hypothetical protein